MPVHIPAPISRSIPELDIELGTTFNQLKHNFITQLETNLSNPDFALLATWINGMHIIEKTDDTPITAEEIPALFRAVDEQDDTTYQYQTSRGQRGAVFGPLRGAGFTQNNIDLMKPSRSLQYAAIISGLGLDVVNDSLMTPVALSFYIPEGDPDETPDETRLRENLELQQLYMMRKGQDWLNILSQKAGELIQTRLDHKITIQKAVLEGYPEAHQNGLSYTFLNFQIHSAEAQLAAVPSHIQQKDCEYENTINHDFDNVILVANYLHAVEKGSANDPKLKTLFNNIEKINSHLIIDTSVPQTGATTGITPALNLLNDIKAFTTKSNTPPKVPLNPDVLKEITLAINELSRDSANTPGPIEAYFNAIVAYRAKQSESPLTRQTNFEDSIKKAEDLRKKFTAFPDIVGPALSRIAQLLAEEHTTDFALRETITAAEYQVALTHLTNQITILPQGAQGKKNGELLLKRIEALVQRLGDFQAQDMHKEMTQAMQKISANVSNPVSTARDDANALVEYYEELNGLSAATATIENEAAQTAATDSLHTAQREHAALARDNKLNKVALKPIIDNLIAAQYQTTLKALETQIQALDKKDPYRALGAEMVDTLKAIKKKTDTALAEGKTPDTPIADITRAMRSLQATVAPNMDATARLGKARELVTQVQTLGEATPKSESKSMWKKALGIGLMVLGAAAIIASAAFAIGTWGAGTPLAAVGVALGVKAAVAGGIIAGGVAAGVAAKFGGYKLFKDTPAPEARFKALTEKLRDKAAHENDETEKPKGPGH